MCNILSISVLFTVFFYNLPCLSLDSFEIKNAAIKVLFPLVKKYNVSDSYDGYLSWDPTTIHKINGDYKVVKFIVYKEGIKEEQLREVCEKYNDNPVSIEALEELVTERLQDSSIDYKKKYSNIISSYKLYYLYQDQDHGESNTIWNYLVLTNNKEDLHTIKNNNNISPELYYWPNSSENIYIGTSEGRIN